MSGRQNIPEPIPSALFRPGEGARPPFLAGREGEQACLRTAVKEIDQLDDQGRAGVPQNIILYGPRGNGKTALTLWLQDWASDQSRGWMPVRINAGDCGGSPNELAQLLAPMPWRKKLLDGGWSASILSFRLSLPARADGSWSVAQALASLPAHAPSILIIDEAHMLEAQACRQLLNASHELRSAGAQLLLVLAGTPELEDRLQATKASHWERGRKVPLGRLDANSALSALLEPLKKHGASMTKNALDVAMRETVRYPFFLQLFGRRLVEELNRANIRQADTPIAECAAEAFRRDQTDFYKTRQAEMLEAGSGLAALAVWGALNGGVSRPTRALALEAMVPFCDSPSDMWRSLHRLGVLWDTPEGIEAGIPSLLDNLVRYLGPQGAKARDAGLAVGRKWAEWQARSFPQAP